MPTDPADERFEAGDFDAGKTLLAALRGWLPGRSWADLRKLIGVRRVSVNHTLCLDESRRLSGGDVVRLLSQSLPPVGAADVRIHYRDAHLVVVEKPPRMLTLRHAAEQHWPQRRKDRQPSLDEIVSRMLASKAQRRRDERRPIFPVHRIDRDTSGLLVFATDEPTQRGLIAMFARHEVDRAYLALVPGHLAARTITSDLVRDRGDGLRGSAAGGAPGRRAVTHLRPLEFLGGYTLLECRLETGRTHQIRIHLAELGHPLCGDSVYRSGWAQPPIEDLSGAPRIALHATRLGFVHPATGEHVQWETPLPRDLERFVERLRAGS